MKPTAKLWMLFLMLIGVSAIADDSFARLRVLAGWQDTFKEDQGWRAEHWKVRCPDPKASADFGPEGAVFRVTTPRAGMGWTRTFNPVWLPFFPYLAVEYEIENTVLDASQRLIILSDDSTGPITPGALNPENPLASGDVAGLGSTETGKHHIICDVREIFKSDRISQITFLLQCADQPATLRVSSLTFWAVDPRDVGPREEHPAFAHPMVKIDPRESRLSKKQVSQWKHVKIPHDLSISSQWVSRALDASWPGTRSIQVSGVPFTLSESEKAACVTAVSESGTIEVPAAFQGTELALLLGLRAYGHTRPSVRKVAIGPREPITSPHEVVVELEYEDGSRRLHMPWSIAAKDYAIERLPQAYIVPLDSERKLKRFFIHDRMNYGQLFLLAASVNTSKQSRFPPSRNGTPSTSFPCRSATGEYCCPSCSGRNSPAGEKLMAGDRFRIAKWADSSASYSRSLQPSCYRIPC